MAEKPKTKGKIFHPKGDIRKWFQKKYPEMLKKLDKGEPIPQETFNKLAREYHVYREKVTGKQCPSCKAKQGKEKQGKEKIMRKWKKSTIRTWMQKHYPKLIDKLDKGENISPELEKKIGGEYLSWRKKGEADRKKRDERARKISFKEWKEKFPDVKDSPYDEQIKAYKIYIEMHTGKTND